MLDKLYAANQTIFIRSTSGPPSECQRVVRNLEVTEGRVYGECTIDGEDWVVRYDSNRRWQTVGKKTDLDACIQGLESSPLTPEEKQLATTPWNQCTHRKVQ